MLLRWVFALCLVASAQCQELSYRLPSAFVPLHYDLVVLPHLDSAGPPFAFEGNVTILLQVNSEESAIVLHAAQSLQVSNAAVVDEAGLALDTTIDRQDVERDFLVVLLADPVAAGSALSLTLSFAGTLATDMKGFYLSTYQHQGTTRYVAATKFEPTYARRAFPCFDEPALKATFTITVVAPPGYAAMAATTATTSDSSDYEGHSEWQFSPLPQLSSYLVSWAVFDPESFARVVLLESNGGGGSYGIASDAQFNAEWPLPVRAAHATLREMNSIFNESLNYYSFMQSLGLVAMPDFISGAMENWGMITFRERLLLASDSSTSTATQQSVVSTITHEIAHQWFGDLVSPAWWTYLWLNEGFATYWSYHLDLALDKDDDWMMKEQFVVSELQSALRSDASSSSHPMSYDRQTPDDIQAIFDFVNYEKAASVIRMFENVMGTAAFQAGLRNYLETNSFSAVTETELFVALDEQLQLSSETRSARKLGDVFHSWTANAGYPVVTANRNYSNDSSQEVLVTQARFLSDPTDSVADAQPPWLVPVWATWPQGEAEMQLLAGAGPLQLTGVSPAADEWLLLNADQAGYYRVQYDEQNWRLLEAQLAEDPSVLSRVSRAQLLDDALSLASASQLSWDVALDLTRYLSAEQDYLPWAAALNNFQLLDRRLANSPARQYLQRYVWNLAQPQWQQLGGYDGDTSLPHVQRVRLSRLQSWACDAGQQDCTDPAVEEFRWVLSGNARTVAADRRSVVYCSGLMATSADTADEAFEHLWGVFEDSATPPNEKNTILNALGCVSQEETAHKYLQKAVDGEVKLQDVSTVFSAVASSTTGAQFALSYLKQNGQAVRELLEEIGEVQSVVTSIVQWLPRDQQTELLDAVSDWGISETLEETIASLDGWLERNEADITDWLQQEVPDQSGSQTLKAHLAVVLCVISLVFNF